MFASLHINVSKLSLKLSHISDMATQYKMSIYSWCKIDASDAFSFEMLSRWFMQSDCALSASKSATVRMKYCMQSEVHRK